MGVALVLLYGSSAIPVAFYVSFVWLFTVPLSASIFAYTKFRSGRTNPRMPSPTLHHACVLFTVRTH
jgi:hypothetical protein